MRKMALLACLLLAGCAARRPRVTVYRFENCRSEGGISVCECASQRESWDASTGRRVVTCR